MSNSLSMENCVGVMSVVGCLALLPGGGPLHAQGAPAPYPVMLPIEQYRMLPAEEIALAKSAAPEAISAAAEILVMGTAGYETAVKGTNGFVCLVERSWANEYGKSDFWNPKNRGPVCYNPPAARSALPGYLTRTKWALAGMSESDMAERSRTDPAGEMRMPESGAMAYMLSQHGYLGDNVKGPWHPHLMFLVPRMAAATWGAGAAHSPITLLNNPDAAVSIFLVPVARWGDGTPDATTAQ